MIDEHAARELKLYIDNDADLHRQQTMLIRKNLITKKARGEYKHDLAVKAFGYLVEAGAKKYAKEFGGTWHQMFDVPTRRAVAEELTRDFEAEAKLGNYDYLLPKKYQKVEKSSPSRHHSHMKSKKATWIVPEGLAIRWSPVNQAYFALWPGRGRVEDQQVLKIADAEGMHSWLRDTYGESFGLKGRQSYAISSHGRKKSSAQLQREIDEVLAKRMR